MLELNWTSVKDKNRKALLFEVKMQIIASEKYQVSIKETKNDFK